MVNLNVYNAFNPSQKLSESQVRSVWLPRTIGQLLTIGSRVYNYYTNQQGFYSQLYYGGLDRIMPPETIIISETGSGPHRKGVEALRRFIKVNWFKKLTRFTVNSMLSEYPSAYTHDFWQAVDSSIMYRSVQGLGVLATEGPEAGRPGRMFAVESRHYRKLDDGHAILIPRDTDRNGVVDAVDIYVLTSDGQSRGYTFGLTGDTLGSMQDEFPIALNGVFTFGDGESDYSDLIDVTREYCVAFRI